MPVLSIKAKWTMRKLFDSPQIILLIGFFSLFSFLSLCALVMALCCLASLQILRNCVQYFMIHSLIHFYHKIQLEWQHTEWVYNGKRPLTIVNFLFHWLVFALLLYKFDLLFVIQFARFSFSFCNLDGFFFLRLCADLSTLCFRPNYCNRKDSFFFHWCP